MFTIGELIDIKNEYTAFCTAGHNIKGGTIIPIYIFTFLIEKYADHVRQYIKDENLNFDYKEVDTSQKPFKICPIENKELIEDIKNWYEENRKITVKLTNKSFSHAKWILNTALPVMQEIGLIQKNIGFSEGKLTYFVENEPIDREKAKELYSVLPIDKKKEEKDESIEEGSQAKTSLIADSFMAPSNIQNEISNSNIDNKTNKIKETSHKSKLLLECDINETKISQICAETAKALIREPGKETDDLLKEKAKEYNDLERAIQKYTQMFVGDHNLIKIIGMTEPTSLDKIFVKANVLEKITKRKFLNLEDLEEWEKEFRKRGSYGKIVEKKVDALELANKNQYMMLLGQPGGGKTTFLKQLGMQAIQGKLNSKRIPIFISLKKLSDSKKRLFNFILKEFEICGFPEANDLAEKSLNDGLFLLLLDGLDEVEKGHVAIICQQLNDFCKQYSNNQYLISCRTAAYRHIFLKFTDVELARFDENQIKQFINNWFGECNSTANKCWEKIKADKNKPILELAQTPLLLILLCLAFDENKDFPENRAELYQCAISVLLKQWDESRHIERGEVYQHLSQKRKKTLLSQIASETFGNDEYFIKKMQIETIIDKYLGDQFDDPPEGEIILEAIEEQHGILVKRTRNIYSFSHLTFQEFFTANYFVENKEESTLESLIEHITDSRWREVFLLTAGLLSEADGFLLLMKKKADSLIKDEKLLKFFSWAKEKADSVQADYKPAAKRIFYINFVSIKSPYTLTDALKRALYFARTIERDFVRTLDFTRSLDFARTLELARAMERNFARTHGFAIDPVHTINLDRAIECVRDFDRDSTLNINMNLDRTRDFDFVIDFSIAMVIAFAHYHALGRVRDSVRARACKQFIFGACLHAKKIGATSSQKSLEKLYLQTPKDNDSKQVWESWAVKIRKIMIKERNIAHDWNFSTEQIVCMSNYLSANELILDCMNCGSYVTKSIREKIENTLLLPFV